jgi:hypothetical protein
MWADSRGWTPSYTLSYGTWAARHKLPYWVIDWYRKYFYDARYPGHDPRLGVDLRRELAFPGSLSAGAEEPAFAAPERERSELDVVISAVAGNGETMLDVSLARVVDRRNSSQARDIERIAGGRARPAAQ